MQVQVSHNDIRVGIKPLNKTYIYGLVDPEEGVPRYIGMSDSPERRFLEHFNTRPLSEKNPKAAWLRELQRSGRKPFLILLDSVPRAEALEAERRWIRHFLALGVNLFNTKKN